MDERRGSASDAQTPRRGEVIQVDLAAEGLDEHGEDWLTEGPGAALNHHTAWFQSMRRQGHLTRDAVLTIAAGAKWYEFERLSDFGKLAKGSRPPIPADPTLTLADFDELAEAIIHHPEVQAGYEERGGVPQFRLRVPVPFDAVGRLWPVGMGLFLDFPYKLVLGKPFRMPTITETERVGLYNVKPGYIGDPVP